MISICNSLNYAVSIEDSYPKDYDMIRVRLGEMLSHPVFVRQSLNTIMRDRFPINIYEAQLILSDKRPTSMSMLAKMWRVYYDNRIRTVVYRAPYFVSILLRRKINSCSGKWDMLRWSSDPGMRGLIAGTNYWTDNVAVIHKELLDGYDLPDLSVELRSIHKKVLELGDFTRIVSMSIVDHPMIHASCPLIEVVTSNHEVLFYDSRYVDLLKARWLFPGALINWVDKIPYLVFKRGRIMPLTGGHIVLAISPVYLNDDEEELWRAVMDGLLYE